MAVVQYENGPGDSSRRFRGATDSSTKITVGIMLIVN